MGRPNAQSQVNVAIEFDRNFKEFELGFLRGSDPKAYRRIMNLASLNAARTMVKPMRNAAPVDTGRLKKSVSAKRGKYQFPSATVGPRPGKTRGDVKGAWYRWMVTSGHAVKVPKTGREATSWGDIGKGVSAAKISGVGGKRVPGKPFVTQTARQAGVMKGAIDAYYATVEKFFNDDTFKRGILKFKRKGR